MESHQPHLVFSRQEPTGPRRRSGRGKAPTKRDDVQKHADGLDQALTSTAESLEKRKPAEFDPGLLLKLEVQPGTLGEQQLRSFGIDVVSEESDHVLVVFVDENAKNQFKERLRRYRAGQSGHGVNAGVFHALERIAEWDRVDRIGRTLANREWAQDENVVVDIEFWPRDTIQGSRRALEQSLAWLASKGAEIWDKLATASVVLARCELSGAALDELLELETVRSIDIPPKFRIEVSQYNMGVEDLQAAPPEDPSGLVAVLDSGVVTGHPLLAQHVGEAASFVEGQDGIDDHGHGTAVASLATFGDMEPHIEKHRFESPIRLLSARVLNTSATYDRKLIATQVSDAVEYLFEAYNCQIFNLSFGDIEHPYDGTHIRGLAAILDELSWQFGVLFVVSAGNFRGTPDGPSDWRSEYPWYLLSSDARLLDPAPAANAITVGSIARYDESRQASRWPRDVDAQPIARVNEPSPFTRCGPGINGSIKPDVVEYGGNWAVNLRAGVEPTPGTVPDPNLSELSFSHDFAETSLFTPFSGTSFATPKVAHLAARIARLYPRASMNFVRALIGLHASIPKSAYKLFPDPPAENRHNIMKLYGYGVPSTEESLYSGEQSVTLYAEEQIALDSSQFYEVPIPEDFFDPGEFTREIRVALAHTPLTRPTRLDYKASAISFKVILEDNVEIVAERFKHKSELDSISELSGMTPSSRFRAPGTLAAAHRIYRRIPSNSPLRHKRLFIVVSHQPREWAKELLPATESYALAVALRTPERMAAQLYTQLQARLRVRPRVQTRAEG